MQHSVTTMPSAPAVPAEVAATRTADLNGDLSWLDYGGPDGAPLVVAVHGLGGAAWNWAALAPLLTQQVRLIAPDLAGHGLTRSGGRRTTVGANRVLLDRFLREVAGEPAVLMGNSMGGAISLLQAAAAPDLVQGLVLVDPALPRPTFGRIDPQVAVAFAVASLPGIGKAVVKRRAARAGVRAQVIETLKLCTVNVTRIPTEVVEMGIAVSEARSADPRATTDFLAASRSVVRLLSRPGPVRRAAAAVDAAAVPVLLLHGDRDRLVSIEIARSFAARHPAWQFEIAHDIGHVPMLEDASWSARQILPWLKSAQQPSTQ